MGRPRSFDEKEILSAVRERFWSAGYAGTSLDDLMKATGLGKGSLYGTFGDKHQLFLRVLDEYCRESQSEMETALQGKGPAIERLRGLFMDKRSPEGAAARRGCLLVNSTSELGRRDPDVLARSRRTFGAMEDAIVACLARAESEGDIPEGTNLRELGGLLFSILQGLESLGKTGMNERALRRIARLAAERLLPVESGKR